MADERKKYTPEQLAAMSAEEFLTCCGVNFDRSGTGFVVEGDLNCDNMGLSRLPDLSSVLIEGSFTCRHNSLASLEGCPSTGKEIICIGNPLESFSGLPEKFGRLYSDCEDLLRKEFDGRKGLPPLPYTIHSRWPSTANPGKTRTVISVKESDLTPYRSAKPFHVDHREHLENLQTLGKPRTLPLKLKR